MLKNENMNDKEKNNQISEEINQSNNKQNEVEKLKQELAICQKKSEEYLNGWRRAKADYINLKRDTEKEKEEFARFASAALIIQLLPIVNNFKRAFEHLSEIKDEKVKSYFVGFKHIYNQIFELLKKLGIEEIKTIGEKFNPQFHEAIEEEVGENKEIKKYEKEQIIVKEVSAGYTMQGRVIMPAKVVVN